MGLGYIPAAGARLRASDLKLIVDQIDSLTAAGWTAFTPTWTGSGSNPVIGNGTLAGWYRRPASSDIVDVVWRVVMGSTTTFGSGTWWLSTPVAPSVSAALRTVGAAYLLDAGTLDKAGVCKFEDATKIKLVATSGGVVTPTNPHTWANTDIILAGASFEPL